MFHRTEFQKKLLSYTWGRKARQGHWFPTDEAPRVVRIPATQEIVTTKRATYAAFKGPIPTGMELRANCGTKQCWCPWHQDLEPSRGEVARALELPDMGVAQRGYQAIVKYEAGNKPPVQLKGLTPGETAAVRTYAKSNSLAQVSAMSGLTVPEVVKVLNGAYDKALLKAEKPLRDSAGSAKGTQAKKESASFEEAAEWLRTVS